MRRRWGKVTQRRRKEKNEMKMAEEEDYEKQMRTARLRARRERVPIPKVHPQQARQLRDLALGGVRHQFQLRLEDEHAYGASG